MFRSGSLTPKMLQIRLQNCDLVKYFKHIVIFSSNNVPLVTLLLAAEVHFNDTNISYFRFMINMADDRIPCLRV